MAIRRLIAILAVVGLMLVMAIPVAANSGHSDHNDYAVHVLVTGPSPDADLVNGWGISCLRGAPGGSPTRHGPVHALQGRRLQAGFEGRDPRWRADRHRVEHRRERSTATCSCSPVRPA